MPTAIPLPFGVSQYTTRHASFESDLAVYPQSGASWIEVCEFKLDPHNVEVQLRGCPIQISSVQPTVHTIYPDSLAAEPADPAQRSSLIRRAMERIGPYVPPLTPFVVNTGIAPNGNFREGWRVVEKECRELADFAAERGLRIAMEPLNPILMNTNSFIWTLDQAMHLVNAVNRPNFGICVDFWNDWQDPLVLDALARCGDRIYVVHVSDWHLPRAFADRAGIGTGEIPFSDLLCAVRSAGYAGPYMLEIFSDDSLPDSLWKQDGRSVIESSREALERAWSESF